MTYLALFSVEIRAALVDKLAASNSTLARGVSSKALVANVNNNKAAKPKRNQRLRKFRVCLMLQM